MNALRLSYLGDGDKILVLFPGWTHPFQKEPRLLSELAKEFRIVLFDLPGYMGNSDSSQYTDFTAVARELHTLLEQAQVKPTAFLGFSMGCRLISTYLDLFPNEVPCIFIGSPIHPFKLPIWGKILVRSNILISILRRTPKLRSGIINMALRTISQNPDDVFKPTDVSYLGAFDSLMGLLTSSSNHPSQAIYIYGERDSYLLDAKAAGESKVKVIPKGDHNCINKHEEAVVKLIATTLKNMQYEIIKLTSTNNKYKDQLDKLSSTCFSWMSDSEETRKLNEDKYFNNDKFMKIIAVSKEKVIGKVGLIIRAISFEGESILLGGLGGVCTIPEKRNMGVASALIQKGMEELENAGCDIAYLCTDVEDKHLVRLYEKAGFKILGRQHSYFGKSGRLYTEDDAMIAPVNSQKKFNKVMNGEEVFHIGKGNW